ncbi:MAG: hypothetical protein QM582_17370 [Micropruina sp.]|uniref:hypothetical protein n=1 Tax=Micropruina sp. TaxID=2737536 RepID=UPI0039E4BAD5
MASHRHIATLTATLRTWARGPALFIAEEILQPPGGKMKHRILAALAAAALAITTVAAVPGTAKADETDTVKVDVWLQGHTNGLLDLRTGSVSYYDNGGWHQVSGLNPNDQRIARAEVKPGTYSFAVDYNGTRAQKQVTVGQSSQAVYFHAALVKLDLRDSKGNPLSVDANGASYYANGWHNFDPNVGVELQPGTYPFTATYNGTRQQKTFTVLAKNPNNLANAVQTVSFQTTWVNVWLAGDTVAPLDLRNGSATYFADGSWRPITGVNVNNGKMVTAEMLPGTYSFAVAWNGMRDQQNSVVVGTSDKSVRFDTALVKATVNGEVPDSASFFAGTWQSLGDGAQMLPGTYTFRVVKDGVQQQKSYTVVKKNPNNGANKLQIVEFP